MNNEYCKLGTKCYSSYPALLSNEKFLTPDDPVYKIVLTRAQLLPAFNSMLEKRKNDTSEIKDFDNQFDNRTEPKQISCKSCMNS